MLRRIVVASSFATLLSGCAGGGSTSSVANSVLGTAVPAYPTATATPATSAAGKIKHVVVIVQENRSFDNLFYGFPGADSATSGLTSTGQNVALQQTNWEAQYDLSHEEADYVRSYDGGKMDGFDRGSTGSLGAGNGGATVTVPAFPQYAYVEPSETATYFAMAKANVLADRFFTSQIDSSFTAHQYLIAAQAGGTVDNPSAQPWGCDAPAGTLVPTLDSDRLQGPGVPPCFTYATLGDELDAANLTWRYYAPAIGGDIGNIWSAYDAIKQIRYGSDWTSDVISPETKVLTDIPGGTLANVTWVVPDLANSDHPDSKSPSGPDWVASIVNAVGASPYWSSTAIVIYWDDWGGFYDHVAPPQVGADGLGFRTPLMILSPYAKHGYVSHVQYESASVARFIESTFGLGTLSAADARAANFDDAFDFTSAPAAFTPFHTSTPVRMLIQRRPSALPPDND